MNASHKSSSTQARESERASIEGVHGVRYQVKDVARATAFYTDHLGFTLQRQQLQCVARRLHAAPQWAGRFGTAANARRDVAVTRRMESSRASGHGPASPERRARASGRDRSQPDGGGPGRPTDSGRRSRREPRSSSSNPRFASAPPVPVSGSTVARSSHTARPSPSRLPPTPRKRRTATGTRSSAMAARRASAGGARTAGVSRGRSPLVC
jgi:hypothetical protein